AAMTNGAVYDYRVAAFYAADSSLPEGPQTTAVSSTTWGSVDGHMETAITVPPGAPFLGQGEVLGWDNPYAPSLEFTLNFGDFNRHQAVQRIDDIPEKFWMETSSNIGGYCPVDGSLTSVTLAKLQR